MQRALQHSFHADYRPIFRSVMASLLVGTFAFSRSTFFRKFVAKGVGAFSRVTREYCEATALKFVLTQRPPRRKRVSLHGIQRCHRISLFIGRLAPCFLSLVLWFIFYPRAHTKRLSIISYTTLIHIDSRHRYLRAISFSIFAAFCCFVSAFLEKLR